MALSAENTIAELANRLNFLEIKKSVIEDTTETSVEQSLDPLV